MHQRNWSKSQETEQCSFWFESLSIYFAYQFCVSESSLPYLIIIIIGKMKRTLTSYPAHIPNDYAAFSIVCSFNRKIISLPTAIFQISIQWHRQIDIRSYTAVGCVFWFWTLCWRWVWNILFILHSSGTHFSIPQFPYTYVNCDQTIRTIFVCVGGKLMLCVPIFISLFLSNCLFLACEMCVCVLPTIALYRTHHSNRNVLFIQSVFYWQNVLEIMYLYNNI